MVEAEVDQPLEVDTPHQLADDGAVVRVRSWDVPADALDLSTQVLRAVEAAWGLALDESCVVSLEGGEESASFRVDDLVIRIGPAWRTDKEAEWCYAVATEAGRRCEQVLAPVRTQRGRATTRISGRPVSVWPFVDGNPGNPENHQHVASAAQVLAGLHQALSPVTPPLRPPASAATVEPAGLDDRQLDSWLFEFYREHERVHPLHGDYYGGNAVVRDDRIVAVFDWDDAFVGPPEVELAWAACEWGNALRRGDLDEAVAFIQIYVGHGGTADPIGEETVAQLYRARLRRELSYEEVNTGPRDLLAGHDRDYRDRQNELFHTLRP